MRREAVPQGLHQEGREGQGVDQVVDRQEDPGRRRPDAHGDQAGDDRRVKTVKIRKSKTPTWTARCLPPGAKKPTACG